MEISVINTIQYKGVFKADLLENSIIEVKWNTELKEVEKKHLMALNEAIKSLGGNKKMRIYVTTFDFMSINDDTRNYSASEEAAQYTLANAVLIDSLAKKILFNFYLKFNKPVRPIRAFTLRSNAFEWLLSIQE